jgi:nucleoside-diphosphate-sugar epimerase
MKLFVTGGTGFVGSHFVKQALASGHAVRALRRPGSQPRIPLEKDPEWLEVPFDQLEREHFTDIDAVVHFAAHSANVPYDTLENCLHWNVTIPLRMARRAQAGGVTRFVVAGSCFEYGRSGERYDFIPVDAPLEPTQSYPTSKAAAAIAWAGFCREMHASVSLLRIFQVYGEGEAASRMWPSLRAAARAGRNFPMTKGEQIRDFIEVGTVAKRFLTELAEPAFAGILKTCNVGSGHPQTLRNFAEYWWKYWCALGQLEVGQVPYRQGEVMRFVPLVSGDFHPEENAFRLNDKAP